MRLGGAFQRAYREEGFSRSRGVGLDRMGTGALGAAGAGWAAGSGLAAGAGAGLIDGSPVPPDEDKDWLLHAQLGRVDGLLAWQGVVPGGTVDWSSVKAMYR